MIVDQRSTQIGRLRIMSRQLDAVGARVKYESVMSSADVKPRHLPPATIVCIQSFRDPNPGLLESRWMGGPVSLLWEKAVTDALDRMVSRAMRPADISVSGSINAVIFENEAELLACLARDWCAGIVATRWWWASLLRGHCDKQAILNAWLDSPQYAPAALQSLATMGSAVTFIKRLDPGFASSLLRRVAETFALPLLKECLDRAFFDDVQERTSNEKEASSANMAEGLNSSSISVGKRRNGWLRLVPEVTGDELTVEQRCLLGVGLMLVRNPNIVRGEYFVRDLARFAEAPEERLNAAGIEDALGLASSPADDELPARDPHVKADQESQCFPPSSAKPKDRTRQSVATLLPSYKSNLISVADSPRQRSKIDRAGIAASHSFTEATQSFATAIVNRKAKPHQGVDYLPDLGEIDYAHKIAAHSEVESAGNAQSPEATTIRPFVETSLGGLFYLINLGLFLNLYGDFTSPNDPGIRLSIWDFITLIGDRIIGDQNRNDPVWQMLTLLAQRNDGETISETFAPHDEWRIPAEWLTPFRDEGCWQWSVEKGRLRVFDPLLFTLVDVPIECIEPSIQLDRELNRYDLDAQCMRRTEPGQGSEDCSLGGRSVAVDASHLLHRWLDRLVPYVRARLQRALGLNESDELARVLFEHRARVLATATHLEIFLSLAELPVEIRFAGLDRNPGWVPAAGRFITFHFD